jgi:hypothetical protein
MSLAYRQKSRHRRGLGGGAGLLADLGLLAIPGPSPLLRLAAVVAGAAAGGIVGALVEGGETRENADVCWKPCGAVAHAGDREI